MKAFDIMYIFIAVVTFFLLYIRYFYTGENRRLLESRKDKLRIDQQLLLKYTELMFGKGTTVTTNEYKWFVTAIGTLVVLTNILNVVYIMYFITRIKGIISDDLSLDTLRNGLDIYVQTKRTHLVMYTFINLMYGLIMTYAYMLTAEDCKAVGIKYTADVWLGDYGNISQDLLSRWVRFFVLKIIGKPLTMLFAIRAVSLLEEYYDKFM